MVLFSREKTGNSGGGILFHLCKGTPGDDGPALCAGLRPQFDQPIRLLQDICVVVHEDDRISVREQVPHDPGEPLQIRWMQTDRGLVQHIEDAGRAVAHRAGQLHPLPFSRGEG